MQAVAIGWQMYSLTSNALDLGLVALMQFLPAALLTLVVGQIADRYDRRMIMRLAQTAEACAAGLLAAATDLAEALQQLGSVAARDGMMDSLPLKINGTLMNSRVAKNRHQ